MIFILIEKHCHTTNTRNDSFEPCFLETYIETKFCEAGKNVVKRISNSFKKARIQSCFIPERISLKFLCSPFETFFLKISVSLSILDYFSNGVSQSHPNCQNKTAGSKSFCGQNSMTKIQEIIWCLFWNEEESTLNKLIAKKKFMH